MSSNHTHFKKKNTLILSSNHMHFNQKCMNFHQSKSNHIHFNQKCMNFIIQPYALCQPKVYEFHHPIVCSISTKKCRNFIIIQPICISTKNIEISSSIHANFEQKQHYKNVIMSYSIINSPRACMYISPWMFCEGQLTTLKVGSPTWLPIPP